MQQCPKCKSASIRRSQTRHWWESWHKTFTIMRPHRCQGCGWRGWGEESMPRVDADRVRFFEQAIVSETPPVDLKNLLSDAMGD
jgi:hypothetical protein